MSYVVQMSITNVHLQTRWLKKEEITLHKMTSFNHNHGLKVAYSTKKVQRFVQLH